MKIGLLLDDSLDRPDGVQQYVLTLGEWLAGQGHEIHFLAGQTKRKDIKRLHSLAKNMTLRFSGNRVSTPLPADKKALGLLLRREDFDVLHVQMPYSPALGGRALGLVPVTTAVVGTFHILPFSRVGQLGNKGLALLSRKSLRRIDQLISVSPAAQTFAKQTYGLTSQVVPNVVAVDKFRPPVVPATTRPNSPLTIVFLGRLVERKGCQYLLKAITLLAVKKLLGDTQVIIGGSGPMERQLKDYVVKHQLQANVRFAGFIAERNKAAFLAAAHLAVFPSTAGESFGIVLLEAMAAGAQVVIGGNNPGYTSVLQDQPDLLIDPTNDQAFAALLERYLKDKTLRQSKQRWQISRVKQFDVKTVGPKILAVYNEALQERRSVR